MVKEDMGNVLGELRREFDWNLSGAGHQRRLEEQRKLKRELDFNCQINILFSFCRKGESQLSQSYQEDADTTKYSRKGIPWAKGSVLGVVISSKCPNCI